MFTMYEYMSMPCVCAYSQVKSRDILTTLRPGILFFGFWSHIQAELRGPPKFSLKTAVNSRNTQLKAVNS